MIDWSNYPLSEARRYSPSYRDELDRLVTDIRLAERKRCAERLRERAVKLTATGECCTASGVLVGVSAIEALKDDDG